MQVILDRYRAGTDTPAVGPLPSFEASPAYGHLPFWPVSLGPNVGDLQRQELADSKTEKDARQDQEPVPGVFQCGEDVGLLGPG
jgi:hypothetical protein